MDTAGEVTVRAATLEDAEAIGVMLAGIIRDHGEEPPGTVSLTAGARRILELPHAGFVLAETETGAGREIVGMVQITERFSTWRLRPFFYLDDFYVAPAWRSHGVGSTLLAEVVRRARANDCTRIDLDVYDENPRAYAFYLREGFVDTREHLMRLDL